MENKTQSKWPAVMIDIETLGTGNDALILGIGAVCFDRTLRITGPMFNSVVNPMEGQKDRKIDPDTLCWWLEKDERAEELRVYFSSDPFVPETLWKALKRMVDFFRVNLEAGCEVWTKGDFDLRILSHAFQGADVSCPWNYWQARELRTVLKWTGVEAKHATAHRALEDAVMQVGLLFEAEGRRMRDVPFEFLKFAHPVKGTIADWSERVLKQEAKPFSSPAPHLDSDFERGWKTYREQLAETRAFLVPEWKNLPDEVKEAFAAAVWAAVEGREP